MEGRRDYNTVRPHSAIGNRPPTVYAKLIDPATQRDRSLRWGSEFSGTECITEPARLK